MVCLLVTPPRSSNMHEWEISVVPENKSVLPLLLLTLLSPVYFCFFMSDNVFIGNLTAQGCTLGSSAILVICFDSKM